MFKPVHGIDGTLVNSITVPSATLVVDDATLCLLKRRLADAGDYTYLLIRQAYDYEIVKTTSFAANGVNVLRAQDGTTALAFPAGAEIEFVLGAAAIQDILAQRGLDEITLEGGGIVTVTQLGVNHYSISAPAISITSSSPNVLVGGTFPNFVLSAPLLTDCCG